jgi:proteasome lid subunit RPN8/RPN11
MKFKFEQDIREHALEVAPAEACGWVIKSATDALQSVRSENTAPDPLNQFQVEMERHLSLVKSGILVAYYHSHVTDEHLTDFSPADKRVSEETGYPVYLYLLKEDKMLVYVPSKFKMGLEGRPYIPRIFDCWKSVKDYYASIGIETPNLEFGLEEALKSNVDIQKLINESSFVPVTEPKKYDALLMHYKSIRPNHFGVYLGDGHFFHQLYNTPSKVEVYGDFWKRNTSLILRHKSLF